MKTNTIVVVLDQDLTKKTVEDREITGSINKRRILLTADLPVIITINMKEATVRNETNKGIEVSKFSEND